MTTTVFSEDDHEAVRTLLVGRSVKKVGDDRLLLDDGTVLTLVGNDGGCACAAGCYDLVSLNGVENIITAVDFEDSPSGDDVAGDGAYRIFVYAGNDRINLATFEGTDGNGYYGTGYQVHVSRPEVTK